MKCDVIFSTNLFVFGIPRVCLFPARDPFKPDIRLFIKRDANTCERLVLRISAQYGRYHELHCHRRGRFIGSHIVEGLAGQKHEVVILDNLFSGKMENVSPFLEKDNVSFVNGSITDLPLLQKTFEGADGIFHEGAIASVPRLIANPLATNEANVTGP